MTIETLTSHLEFDRGLATPLYRQLETQLGQLIRTRAIEPGDKIPGDQELSVALGVNHRTVRRAMQPLVDQGLIRRTRRAGTFVCEPKTHTGTIGFFYFHEAFATMSRMAQDMQRYAEQHGFDLKIKAYERDFFQRVELASEVERMGLSGLIATVIDEEPCRQNLLRLQKTDFPCVMLGTGVMQRYVDYATVRSDSPLAVYDALSFLWRMGHRKIGYFHRSGAVDSVESWRTFMGEHSPYPERLLLDIDYDGTLESLYQLPVQEILEDYLQRNPDITAICGTMLIHEFIKVAAATGRTVPNDLSAVVIGTVQPWSNPDITAFRPPEKLIAEASVHQLLDNIHHGRQVDGVDIAIPYTREDSSSVVGPPIHSHQPLRRQPFATTVS